MATVPLKQTTTEEPLFFSEDLGRFYMLNYVEVFVFTKTGLLLCLQCNPQWWLGTELVGVVSYVNCKIG